VSHPEQIIPHGHILRYTLRERLMHWVAAGAYIYLLLTGLAFWSPWLFWLAILLGGAPVSRMLHPWAGLIFSAVVGRMYTMWAPQMRTTKVDKAWWRALPHYIRNEDDKMPPAGRYNAGQKALFWSFFWCGLASLITGIILWVPESIPWNLRFLRYIAIFVHPAAALLTIGSFMIHIYMSVFAERGAFGSVIRGDVSKAFAKRYHPGWYDEITGPAKSQK
jgi:formate dehydrogenase subunit gamma